MPAMQAPPAAARVGRVAALFPAPRPNRALAPWSVAHARVGVRAAGAVSGRAVAFVLH